MFGKKNKTIFDYVMSWEPKHQIEDLIRPTYLENTASVDHRELEKDVHEYWDLLHPMIQDFINSYALTYQKMSKEMSEFREQLDGYRRKLTLEQQNVQDLSDELREVKATLHEEAVMRRDLDERLKDESTALQARFDDEKRALEIIANTKLGDGLSMEKVMSELRKNTASSD
ncbi:MAG: hypothetical protein OEY49_04515, partial [Candidatus Heimdallarchaeota archaeon]|nr:hypothetical protein [Candidatus Heimdallarchaeota archaeon]